MDLALNNLQWLICHKTNPNRSLDIALLANSPVQAQSLLHSLKQAAAANADKIEYMCFN